MRSYRTPLAVRDLCVIWMFGIALFMGNGGSLRMVYAGRFIAGKPTLLIVTIADCKAPVKLTGDAQDWALVRLVWWR